MPIALRTAFLAVALLVSSCNEPEGEACVDCAAESLLRQAKEDIGAGSFSRAIDKCSQIVAAEPEHVDGHYCLFVAHLGEMTNGINDLLAAIGSQLPQNDPVFAPYAPAVDAKPVVAGYFEHFEDDMIAVDREVQFLAARPDLSFQVVRFPVNLEFQRIAAFVSNYGDRLPGELILDLGGTWDTSEVLLLGSLFNASLAAIDYLMAHDLELRRIPSAYTLSELVAEVLVANPSFLAFDPGDARDRLAGTGAEKGFRRNVIATLSYLAGREDTFEGVVAANEGLQSAIGASAASAVTDPVIKWIDEDGDGNPEALEARWLSDALDQLAGVYVPRFPTLLSGGTFDAFYALAGALRDNAEHGGDAVPVAPFLESVRGDLGSFTTWPFGYKPVPDAVALDLNPFLEETPPVRDLMPHFYKYDGAYNLAYEFEWAETYGDEVWDAGTRYYDLTAGYWNLKTTFTHFDDGGLAALLGAPGLVLADDGVGPNWYARTLVYLGMQDPSFGGLLHVSLKPLGGTGGFDAASHGSLNQALNRLLKYYCVDLGESQYGWDFYLDVHEDCPDGSEL